MKPGFSHLLLLLCVFFTFPAHAADTDLPGIADVQRQIDNLGDPQSLDADKAALRDELTQTLQWLNELADNEKRQQQVAERLARAPTETLRISRELSRFTPSDPDALRRDYEARDIDALVAELLSLLERQEQLQEQLSDATSDVSSNQMLPERAQNAIASTLDELEAARSTLIQLNVRDDALDNTATTTRLRAQIAALNSRLELRRIELQANSDLQTLASQQAALLQRRIDDDDTRLGVLQSVLEQKRQVRTRAAIEAASEQIAALPDSPLLRDQLAQNQALAERILTVTAQVNEQLRVNLQLRNQLDKVRQLERSLTEQVAALQGSLLLSRILYQQQRLLPRLDDSGVATPDIAELRLEQFQITDQREALLDTGATANRLLAGTAETDNTDIRAALLSLLNVRKELLQQLDPELSRLLTLSINATTVRAQLDAARRTARDTIQQQLFWMPSSRPLSLSTLRESPGTLAREWRNLLHNSYWQQALERFQALWPVVAFAALVALVLLWRRRSIKTRLKVLHQDVGFLKQDSQQHTPLALWLTLLLTAPLPLVLVTLGLVLRSGDTPGAVLIGAVLMKVSMIVLVFGTLLRLLGKDSVITRHFRWPADNVRLLRRQTLFTALAFLPLGIVIAIGERAPELLADDILGLLVVLVSGPLLAVLLWRLAEHYPSKQKVRLVRYTTVATVALIPLILTVLGAVGYYYTAVQLGGRLVDTFYLLLLWLLIGATVRRGLTLAARRLAYRRALARREEQREQKAAAEAGEQPEVVEEPPMDLELVNTQSLRLANLFLLLAFGVAIYWVWADLIGAMSYLDNVTLWQQTLGEGAQAREVSTSLGDVLFALIFLVVALMMARNLPGLLEVMILSRLALRPGSAYAITSLLAYTLTAVGILVSLGSLGVSWSKLQWLVAALGVGLGFGLQEVFGNFVSGIIILFERPVRIGDLVTIGDLSGTVNRIRIRATTIRDFDNKEIIIPNKSFVTDRLINWSLSDSVTRLVIQVGFAYGSDLELARKVLLQAASENPRVMKTPAPLALFTAFGASSLDHELRLHVHELSDRVPAGDELLRRIDALCRENGLEIAFNQLDVFIKNKVGEEIAIRTQQDGGPAQV
ncbi:MscS family transporter [Isoalcanivorax pacificus W11-5]|uniref:MscS family transporter n=1 Tax=Isoalcanivorax pacificus W11-5 TaxID=391936 RepID=A0A0B4XKU5_9GAMM|nr:mechanosensitive channel MscK [Isoalcanivorax pacificus]AJD47305.1 MscS family transporter [Isoalcanivorax pacificus W11-5]